MSQTAAKISEKVSDAFASAKDALTGAAESAGLTKESLPPARGTDADLKRRSIWSTSAEDGKQARPSANQAVCWMGPNKVGLKDVGYPKMQIPSSGKPVEHGVILKVVASGICGSDLHMYRGSTAAKPGMSLGHEITGQVVELGSDVERWDLGDFVSVPFNVSCGRCDNCREMKTSACLKCNPELPGAAFGFPQMGDWQGGQSEYIFVPYADHMLLRIPKDVALSKIRSLAFLSDIFPTGYNGAVQAGVKQGSLVYIAGCGPVGLCAAQACFLLGAAAVFIADLHADRLALAKQIGCHTIDLSKMPSGKKDAEYIYAEIEKLIPRPEKNAEHELVDCAIDCIGYEACGCGHEVDKRVSEQALNTCFTVVKAGGGIGIPGLYPMADPKGVDADRKSGHLHLQFGVAWNKAISLKMGQCPVIAYNKDLMKQILYDRVDLGKLLNVKVISLQEAPQAYDTFNKGEAVKFLIDPHGMLR